MVDGVRRPTTLLVSPWTPYPLVFGGAIRVYYLAKMLAAFSDVTMVAFRSWTDVPDVEDHLEAICDRVVLVDGKPEQTATLRLRSMLSRRSFQRHAHQTKHFQEQIDDVTSSTAFDNVVVTLTQMGFYTFPSDGAVKVLDMHNVEHELLLRRASLERKRVKRVGLWLEGTKFRREELRVCRSFDLVLTPSDRERVLLQGFGGMPPIATIPNTIDPGKIQFLETTVGGKELLFVGTTQVDANRDGLLWFVDNVLPLVQHAVPDVRLRIVGGAPPPDVQALDDLPNVDVTGYVPDVAPYMAGAAVFIVPLRTGGGTRLKILEALAYGVPTVSTAVGAEGLHLIDGEHLLIGDEPAAFADQVIALLNDRRMGDRIRRQGRAAVEDRYSWQAVAVDLSRSIERVPRRA